MLAKQFAAFSWFLLLAVLISSCKQSAPPQTKYIPKDAAVVLSINPKKLKDKLDDSKISFDSIMRSAFSEDTSLIITGDDIASSGVDVTKDIFLFVNQSGSMMSGSSVTTGIVAALHKASDFETFLKKKMPSVTFSKGTNYSYATLKNGFTAGWNDDVVIVNNVSGYNMQTGEKTGTSDAAHQQLNTLFSQKEEASLASLKQFKEANDGKADMFFWSNSNGSLSSIPMIGMSKASDLFKDTYSSGTINFEKGEVDLDMKTYPNETFADTLKKYAGPKVDMDLLNKYPGAVNGFAVFSFNPKLLLAILNFAGVAQTANQFLQNQGYTLDDITTALKGDFAIIFSNVGTTKRDVQGQAYSVPTAHLIVDAAIGDKASYDKIVGQLAKRGLMVQKNGQYVPAFLEDDPQGFSMFTDNKNIVFSSDSALLKQYVAGSGKISLPSDVAGKTKGTATAFYVDIASVLNAMPADTSLTKMTDAAKQTFKDVVATADNYGSGVIKGHAELHTLNEKENSLATLTRYFGSLAETMKKMKSATGTDDIDINPPMSNLPDSMGIDQTDSTEK